LNPLLQSAELTPGLVTAPLSVDTRARPKLAGISLNAVNRLLRMEVKTEPARMLKTGAL